MLVLLTTATPSSTIGFVEFVYRPPPLAPALLPASVTLTRRRLPSAKSAPPQPPGQEAPTAWPPASVNPEMTTDVVKGKPKTLSTRWPGIALKMTVALLTPVRLT